jgi:RNA polymerase sigma-70 factor (ECF subfamily)
VYQSVSSFKGESKFSTWLYRITVSKALDHEKRKKRKKRFAFVQTLFGNNEEEQQIQPAEFNHPGVQMEQKERAAELFNALRKLPDKQRTAFMLHKLEGQSYQEVAEILNTTLYAVESLIARAKINLRKILSSYYKKKNPE